jgi:hypothetical protein
VQIAQSFEFLNYDRIAIICELRVFSAKKAEKARICSQNAVLVLSPRIAPNKN